MLALVSASDALMLGMLSQDELSAVSLAGQITFVENLFLAAMTIGLSMLASQYWGKKDLVSVEKIFGYIMKVTAGISFLFFGYGYSMWKFPGWESNPPHTTAMTQAAAVMMLDP